MPSPIDFGVLDHNVCCAGTEGPVSRAATPRGIQAVHDELDTPLGSERAALFTVARAAEKGIPDTLHVLHQDVAGDTGVSRRLNAQSVSGEIEVQKPISSLMRCR